MIIIYIKREYTIMMEGERGQHANQTGEGSCSCCEMRIER